MAELATVLPLKRFSAVHVVAGEIRRVTFEARDDGEAKEIAVKWNVGIEGEADTSAVPEAYDEKTARHLLGGISRTTLYAWLATGVLQRVPDTRRVLITRKSIELRCRS